VAFMLVHYFWLLEFKFKFEFYCLKPLLPKMLNPFLFFLNPFPLLAQPSSRPAAQLAQQPASLPLQGGPPVIPQLQLVSAPDSAAAAPPESDPRTRPCAWPARQGAPARAI
jgi:hypothetical protein